ncbi:MAG: hypothetical protein MHPDNHAH_02828 [Anaerolineales bacterium]|nr:hypothetical protein [Anaerolineales bacterium]
MKDLFLAFAFLSVIFGYTLSQMAPDAWAQILRLLGI